jgi:hypothetical protein
LSMDIFLEHAHPSLVILSPPMLIQVTTVGEVLGTLDTIEST